MEMLLSEQLVARKVPEGSTWTWGKSHVTLSCLLYPYWDAWAKHLSTTLCDHLSFWTLGTGNQLRATS